MVLRRRLAALLVSAFLAASVAPAESAPAAFAPAADSVDAIRSTLALARATPWNDRDGDRIFDSLEERFAVDPTGPEPVIITFAESVSFHAAYGAAQATVPGLSPTFVFPRLHGFAAHLGLPDVLRLATLAIVRQIEWSQPGYPELDTATTYTGVRSVQEQLGLGGDLDGNASSFTNQDVTIAVLDTGFDPHADFQGKFLAFLDTEDKTLREPYDSGAHGTHVASIAAGRGLGEPRLAGVAPGASLVGIKITGPGNWDEKAAALYGIDWILGHAAEYGIRILTLSFGFGPTRDGTDALELAMDRAFEAGILPFKSTGNSGPEPGTVTIPGGARGIVSVANMMDPGRSDRPRPQPVPSVPPSGGGPAISAGCGATYVSMEGVPSFQDYDYGFHLACSSSRGPTADGRPKPDLATPGTSILAARNKTLNEYHVMSGTSMASPFAAGVAALVLSANPRLTPDEVRQLLFKTAEDWGEPGHDPEYGHGRIDALRAVQTALLERWMKERRPFDDLAALEGVAGPVVPSHQGAILSETVSTFGFQVENTSRPVAVTVIHDRADNGGTSVPARALLVQVYSPGGAVGRVFLAPSLRQQTIAFLPRSAGDHTVRLVEPQPGDRAIVDVSVGTAPAGLGLGLPERSAYEANGICAQGFDEASGRCLDANTPNATPGLGLWLTLVACLFVLIRRSTARVR